MTGWELLGGGPFQDGWVNEPLAILFGLLMLGLRLWSFFANFVPGDPPADVDYDALADEADAAALDSTAAIDSTSLPNSNDLGAQPNDGLWPDDRDNPYRNFGR